MGDRHIRGTNFLDFGSLQPPYSAAANGAAAASTLPTAGMCQLVHFSWYVSADMCQLVYVSWYMSAGTLPL
ncbi:MAG: hypothetical protein F6J92_35985, partial [Symploca sp. SIO1A3]|nr:hypothetical protein [Symploca sp. SIO1A3]